MLCILYPPYTRSVNYAINLVNDDPSDKMGTRSFRRYGWSIFETTGMVFMALMAIMAIIMVSPQ